MLWSLNYVELERLRTEEVVANFNKPSWKFSRGTEETQERTDLVRIADTPAGIRSERLLNKNQNCYNLNQLDLYLRVKSVSFISDIRNNAMFSVLHSHSQS